MSGFEEVDNRPRKDRSNLREVERQKLEMISVETCGNCRGK